MSMISPTTVPGLLAQAIAHHQAGQLSAAEELYRSILVKEPDQPDALHLIGVIAHQLGRHDVARGLIEKAISRNGAIAGYYINLGNVLVALDDHQAAVTALETAIRLAPQVAEAHANYALSLLRLGRFKDAAAAANKALKIDPKHPGALINLGLCQLKSGRADAAAHAFRKALRGDPQAREAKLGLIRALAAGGPKDQAEALALAGEQAKQGDDGEVLALLGGLELHAGLTDAADATTAKALVLAPGDPTARINRAAVQIARGELDQARGVIEPLLRTAPVLPAALVVAGQIDVAAGNYQEAAAAFRRALAADPENPAIQHELGNALYHDLQLAEAEKLFAQAAAKAASARTLTSLGLTRLSLGDLARGWKDYESRFDADPSVAGARSFRLPRWKGQPLAGKKLLVWREQGVGDEMIFARLYPEIIARAGQGQVVIDTDPRLTALFARSFPGAHFVPASETQTLLAQDPAIGFQIPALSACPLLYPGLTAMPGSSPRLVLDPAQAGKAAQWLSNLPAGLRIGICWRSLKLASDRSRNYAPLADFAALATLPGAVLVSLQYGDTAAEIAAFKAATGHQVHVCPDLDLTNEFDGTAALAAGLDFVVSVDTVMAPLSVLAGAPTYWLTTPGRWPMFGTERYPLLPEARLQIRPLDENWPAVIGRVIASIKAAAA